MFEQQLQTNSIKRVTKGKTKKTKSEKNLLLGQSNYFVRSGLKKSKKFAILKKKISPLPFKKLEF